MTIPPEKDKSIRYCNRKHKLILPDLKIKTLYEGNNDTNAFTDAEKVLVGKINDKVDKETGKQLSDQNFTLAEKKQACGT